MLSLILSLMTSLNALPTKGKKNAGKLIDPIYTTLTSTQEGITYTEVQTVSETITYTVTETLSTEFATVVVVEEDVTLTETSTEQVGVTVSVTVDEVGGIIGTSSKKAVTLPNVKSNKRKFVNK